MSLPPKPHWHPPSLATLPLPQTPSCPPGSAVLLTFLALASQAAALEIRETRWGFDGRGPFRALQPSFSPRRLARTKAIDARSLSSKAEASAALSRRHSFSKSTSLRGRNAGSVRPFITNEYSLVVALGSGEKAHTTSRSQAGRPLPRVAPRYSSAFPRAMRLRTFPDDPSPPARRHRYPDQRVMDHVPNGTLHASRLSSRWRIAAASSIA